MDYYKKLSDTQVIKYDGKPLREPPTGIMQHYIANPTDEQLREFGYKPLVGTDMPEREGYYYVPNYIEEQSQIRLNWVEYEVQEKPIEE